jgi:transposase InsO family protein
VKNILTKYEIERWKLDNAGENVATQKAFEEHGFGIKIEYTAQKTPQQNGMVERAFATLYGRIFTLNKHAGFE